MRAAAAVLLAALAAAGCTRTRIVLGRPVVADEAAAIVPGLSKGAVLARLGPPDRVEIEPQGSAFEFLYSRTAERALDVSLFQASFSWEEARTHVERLRVSFDGDGRVRHVGVLPAEPPGAERRAQPSPDAKKRQMRSVASPGQRCACGPSQKTSPAAQPE